MALAAVYPSGILRRYFGHHRNAWVEISGAAGTGLVLDKLFMPCNKHSRACVLYVAPSSMNFVTPLYSAEDVMQFLREKDEGLADRLSALRCGDLTGRVFLGMTKNLVDFVWSRLLKRDRKKLLHLIHVSRRAHKRCLDSDSDVTTSEHLERLDLVEWLEFYIRDYRMFVLSAPHGAGKTFLFQMLKAKHKDMRFIRISLKVRHSINDLLLDVGIDVENKRVEPRLLKNTTVVFIDDAEEVDSYYCTGWAELVCCGVTWIPSNIRVIISSTDSDPRPHHRWLPDIRWDKFQLTAAESRQYLEFANIGLPEKLRKHPQLIVAVIEKCGGLIGALKQSVEYLSSEFKDVIEPSETDSIKRYGACP